MGDATVAVAPSVPLGFEAAGDAVNAAELEKEGAVVVVAGAARVVRLSSASKFSVSESMSSGAVDVTLEVPPVTPKPFT